MGVLAAIVVPNVTGLIGSGQPEAAKAELVTVQGAMDTMMAKLSLSTVSAVTTATGNMAAFPDRLMPCIPITCARVLLKGLTRAPPAAW